MFEIYDKKSGESENIDFTDYHTIYNYLLNHFNIDEETAEDIDEWAQYSTVDEKRETENFIITCKR